MESRFFRARLWNSTGLTVIWSHRASLCPFVFKLKDSSAPIYNLKTSPFPIPMPPAYGPKKENNFHNNNISIVHFKRVYGYKWSLDIGISNHNCLCLSSISHYLQLSTCNSFLPKSIRTSIWEIIMIWEKIDATLNFPTSVYFSLLIFHPESSLSAKNARIFNFQNHLRPQIDDRIVFRTNPRRSFQQASRPCLNFLLKKCPNPQELSHLTRNA